MKRCSRPFTLLEVLASLVLTSLLLTLLLAFYRQVHRGSDEEALQMVWRRYAAHQRLGQILMYIQEKLYMDGEDLVCLFSNGVDQERPFSGEILARLYKDEFGRVILATWPHPERWKLDPLPYRTEVLCTDVCKLAFQFYNPPDLSRPSEEVKVVPEHWVDQWSASYPLPAMVRVTLSFEDEELSSTYSVLAADAFPRFQQHSPEEL